MRSQIDTSGGEGNWGKFLLSGSGKVGGGGNKVLSWFLQRGAGLEVITLLCTQENWGLEMDPPDFSLSVIRPADFPSPSLRLSDNFLFLKQLPNSGTLCRHFKIGLMEAIRCIYMYILLNMQSVSLMPL